MVERRTFIKGVGGAAAGTAIAGCLDDSGTAPTDDGADGSGEDTDGEVTETRYGTLSTSVTDQPNDIGDFESLVVTIDGVWIKPAGGSNDNDTDEEENGNGADAAADDSGNATSTDDDGNENDEDGDENDDDGDENDDDGNENEGEDVDEGEGRYYIEFDEPQQADLVELQGDNTQLIDETEVEVGEYQFLQLDVSDTDGILEADGEEADVNTPGNAPLQFQQAFEIREDERTRFIADFAPHRQGHGGYLIRPVASGTQVRYGDEEYEPEDDAADTSDDGDDGGADNASTGNGSQSDDDHPGQGNN
ncbi:DUF4382 domain-containing protein [Halorubrum vacuolatum]|uniref:TAT (Twin-arginine translocation) pathway signal sequence n=1 Tax=Halorubrum vacuolatum TaxID=63740 RepID=A0A238XA29_HALVU|nr:DUF4382 domain-containing protein [Halorubrum vacuolatum]SNR55895.1 TAT (twin-arginine translocation) pathway signal sequence [Halorubrum vacuolatum]